jgi:hypothetical protein
MDDRPGPAADIIGLADSKQITNVFVEVPVAKETAGRPMLGPEKLDQLVSTVTHSNREGPVRSDCRRQALVNGEVDQRVAGEKLSGGLRENKGEVG